ncbi:MAG: SBBP repeat-containing protein [Ignavibacteria bacterium]|nr:SBBP repeat-containing protein [Ignavibacteria bacterium]
MNLKSFFILLYLCLFFYSFSNKTETIRGDNCSPKFVNSLVQSTDYLKLYINSPMKLAEYTTNKNNKSNLIKSATKDIIFIPNKAQIIDTERKLRPDILYKAELNGVDLYLTNKGMSFVFYKYEDKPQNLAAGEKERKEELHPFRDEPMKDKVVKMYRMDLDIVGMNSNFSILNEEQTQEYFNYYYAHCPEGIINVHGFRKVIYKNVYDNIDMVFHSNEKGLKYDFIVKPGGNVSDIKLKYENEDAVNLTKDGKIKALNPFGEIETDVLYTYQSDGKVIESCYEIEKDGTISINTKEYDKTKNLTIDPFIGATYYGGSSWEEAYSITTDENNNFLLTGYTHSTNFPVKSFGSGAYFQGNYAGGSDYGDVFILKFDSIGTRLWATYYGGSGGHEWGHSITTDENRNILITGSTTSLDFPVYDPGGGAYFQGLNSGSNYDIFIIKFTPYGHRRWATYYGGSAWDYGYAIITDENNNTFITGVTGSYNLPLYDPGSGAYFQGTYGGSQHGDVYILKFDSIGTRQWATYYGGSNGESGFSITTNGNNDVYITGYTDSPDFALENPGGGAYFQSVIGSSPDAFILKFNPNGVRQWATYYGGSSGESGYSITTNGNNDVSITGYTNSPDFALKNPGGGAYFQSVISSSPDVFILKFNPNGIRQWATYYGGNGDDWGNSITTDESNNILITGGCVSTDFPLENPGGGAYFQDIMAGVIDIFILKFNPSGVRQWATYYGGDGFEKGNSISADRNNNILLTGATNSSNFPVFNPGSGAYYRDTSNGDYDVFIIGFRPSGVIGINMISSSVPDNYKLHQNFPNPFNPTTNIKFDLKKPSYTKLIVYDILGKEVATLVNEKLNAGSYEVNWDASHYPSGVYFYRIVADDYINTKKMLLIK